MLPMLKSELTYSNTLIEIDAASLFIKGELSIRVCRDPRTLDGERELDDGCTPCVDASAQRDDDLRRLKYATAAQTRLTSP